MKLTVVGCSGSFPGPDAPASCYLLEHDHGGRTWRVLVDLGNGALGALQRYVDPLTVDAVLLSHLHADHCLDLCGFYVLRKYHPTGPQPRIPVWGPHGTAVRMAKAYDLDEDPGMSEEFDFRLYPEVLELGPFTVTPVRVNHPVEAYGLRVEEGSTVLAYTGDTDSCDALESLCRKADVLLADAAFVDGRDDTAGIHLSGRRAAEAALSAGGVQRLVLTHLPPWNDPHVAVAQAREVWEGPLDVAAPGRVFDL